jgi:hypothetical protein
MSRELYGALDGGLSILKESTYKSDGLATIHSSDFLNEEKFEQSFNRSLNGIPPHLVESIFRHIKWRAHICCWAANQARNLEGDFVECGVWYGVLSKTIAEYTNFNECLTKKFYLLDSFGALGRSDRQEYEPDIYEIVKERFSDYENVELIRGIIPDSLKMVTSEKISYLSIDMNGVEPEKAALHYFYNKMVSGGVIYFDDYGFSGHKELKVMIDNFFEDKPEKILYMPTGQGIVIKI